MTKAQAKQRILKLRIEIEQQRYNYHVLDAPSMSDAALDSLKNELQTLEGQYPDLITPDSPTQRVGGEPLGTFVKVEHATRMLSLQDAFNRTDIEAWVVRVAKNLPKKIFTFFCEPKIDGLAMSLMYQDGLLVTAATRGNGSIGEDVTHAVKTIQSVPLRLRAKHGADRGRVEIRGEVYMERKVFDAINRQRAKAGEPLYMNPRNTAAGTIRNLDPSVAASRKLKFLAYSLPTDLGQTTHQDEHQILRDIGFYIDPLCTEAASADDIFAFYHKLEKLRKSLPHQIDGVVIQVNSNKQFARLGVVGKAPRGAIALKFPAEQTTTVVQDIQIQIGRTGAATPVAHLRPVEVAGSLVQRATLHNIDEIKRLDVRIGDTVIIEKAGDIIPDVVEVLPNLRTGAEKTFRMPRHCPVCKAPLKRTPGEVAYYCTNRNCLAKHREGLYHFVSKKAVDIDGLGPKIVDALLEEGLVQDAADFFTLTEDQLAPLEGFAELAAKNLVSAITAARRVPLARLIFGLGIRHVGEQTAQLLAREFGTIKKLQAVTVDQLEGLHDIGPTAAKSIVDFFASKKTTAMLQRLLPQLQIEAPAAINASSPLNDKAVLFTGTLQTLTRDQAKDIVRSNGGTIVSSVSSQLDYLVVGAKPGSKLAKATQLNITVLSENQFLRLASGGTAVTRVQE